MAICWALAAIMTPYLVTKPSHVHALVYIFCAVFLGKSVVNYSDATDVDISSSTIAVFASVAFFGTMTHSPLSWLSLFLYGDPSQVPVSGRPTPISQWFSRPHQLIPADSGSQAPDAALSEARKTNRIEYLLKELTAAKDLIMTYVGYVNMYEESQLEITKLKTEIDGCKEEIKAHKEDAVYARAERDLFEKESVKDKARADKSEKTIVNLMADRDQRIHSGVCRWCKPKVNRAARALENATKKHHAAAATETDAAKDRIIAEKDKIISAKTEEALAAAASAYRAGSPQKADLVARVTALEKQLREKDAALGDRKFFIDRLNGFINARRYCCCGRCPGAAAPTHGPNDDDDDHHNTNGGPPQGGNAQPPAPASEPSGAPPCPVGEPSNPPPPPTTGAAPSGDNDDGAPVPPVPGSPVSSTLSSTPPSPISFPPELIPLPPSPVTSPTASPAHEPAAAAPLPPPMVPLPASPVASTVPPASVPAAPVPVPEPGKSVPAPTLFARATPGFGPASSSLFVASPPPATGTSGPQPSGT